LELHARNTGGPAEERAPDELKKTHPLGKAPQLVTADGRVIIESSAIALYLIKTYDTTGKFRGDPSTGNDEIRDEMLSSFANASLAPIMIIEVLFDKLAEKSPFFIRFLFNGLHSIIRKTFTGNEFANMFQYLNDELRDQDYFMGKSPGRADFMISWPVDYCSQRGYADVTKYPKLSQWHDRVHARNAWRESLNKGNGYKL
jgi:glutathione S-transferase